MFALADAPGPSSSTRRDFVGEIETRKRQKSRIGFANVNPFVEPSAMRRVPLINSRRR